MTDHSPGNLLIVGASSTIARSLMKYALTEQEHNPELQLTAISRSGDIPDDFSDEGNRNLWFQCDYSLNDIETICQQQTERLQVLDTVIICNGKLHDQHLFPEKRIKDFDHENFAEVMHSNATIPFLWLQCLYQHLPRRRPINVVLFSARVGSISDNRLGGWYSYRASKACLNMLVKTFSPELNRTHPQVKLFLFHPGTTDTPLSKPFQNNVPEGKLFTPEFVANQLLSHLQSNESSANLQYLDWQGEQIPW
ncbi:MAG: SDR family oxidoreductase [Candidatus Pelagadaptatus aseana]|uniref:SDR family NAD(P)-dependent oxidoreductase n=1 Tax=Candidatus Pelagadaptatus aseana TaxID=3120508 RepID=UPI0039B317FE